MVQLIRMTISKLLQGVLILISVVVLITSVIYLAPVDPARLTFGQRSDNASVLQKQKELGLDKPLSAQMTDYLKDISPLIFANYLDQRYQEHVKLKIPLGFTSIFIKSIYLRESYQTGQKVSSMLKEALPKTFILAITSFLIASIIGIILGIIAGIFKDQWIDKTIIAFATLGISVPSYVVAIIFAIFFGYLLRTITGLNMQGSIFEVNDYGNDYIAWKNLILPAIALGIRPISVIAQLMRSSYLDVMNGDYIRTAKSKGLAFAKIVSKHAVPNALNPIVTSLTGWFASLLAGAYFVEKVFNFKGLGELTINGLINYDIPVILACLLVICIVFILINILTDILYVIIDPRQRR
jgi:peptide/nickel transport system permease protein